MFLLSVLREMYPNTEFFLVRIFLYSDWIRRLVNLCIQSEWHFSHSAAFLYFKEFKKKLWHLKMYLLRDTFSYSSTWLIKWFSIIFIVIIFHKFFFSFSIFIWHIFISNVSINFFIFRKFAIILSWSFLSFFFSHLVIIFCSCFFIFNFLGKIIFYYILLNKKSFIYFQKVEKIVNRIPVLPRAVYIFNKLTLFSKIA